MEKYVSTQLAERTDVDTNTESQWVGSPDVPAGESPNHDSLPAEPELSNPARERSPLRSLHTHTFARLLEQFGVSVAVTTYQAGFVVLLRHDGQSVNTHFRRAKRPMGLATSGSRLAVGVAREVVHFENMADVCGRLEGPENPQRHDACYLPRSVHVTGNVDIHEMAWGNGDGRSQKMEAVSRDDATQNAATPREANESVGTNDQAPELWFVNTRFSCLCTLDREHSFVPRWRPPFISSLSPQDRCHLNGLAMVNGRPRYVTAHGDADSPQGWREHKADGGVLIDVESGETITRGLAMPHSPRWYNGRLWLLESGDGSIGTVDLKTGRYEAVARVDGFTRGLDFVGPYALVGVSQVRESAVFSGIPISERLDPDHRLSGVSLIDLRSGREVGFVRFEDAVQEVFAVQTLSHRFPEMLEMNNDLIGTTYALPRESLDDVAWLTPKEKGIGNECDNAGSGES